MTAKKRITLRIPQSLNDCLTNLSKETGVSKNALILQILWEQVEIKKISNNSKIPKLKTG